MRSTNGTAITLESCSGFNTDAFFSLGPPETKSKDFTKTINSTTGDMVSRRKILSRSRDDLNSETYVQEEEDVWYQKEKLFRVSFEIKISVLMKTKKCNEPETI